VRVATGGGGQGTHATCRSDALVHVFSDRCLLELAIRDYGLHDGNGSPHAVLM
jgi:hypothetical protein